MCRFQNIRYVSCYLFFFFATNPSMMPSIFVCAASASTLRQCVVAATGHVFCVAAFAAAGSSSKSHPLLHVPNAGSSGLRRPRSMHVHRASHHPQCASARQWPQRCSVPHLEPPQAPKLQIAQSDSSGPNASPFTHMPRTPHHPHPFPSSHAAHVVAARHASLVFCRPSLPAIWRFSTSMPVAPAPSVPPLVSAATVVVFVRPPEEGPAPFDFAEPSFSTATLGALLKTTEVTAARPLDLREATSASPLLPSSATRATIDALSEDPRVTATRCRRAARRDRDLDLDLDLDLAATDRSASLAHARRTTFSRTERNDAFATCCFLPPDAFFAGCVPATRSGRPEVEAGFCPCFGAADDDFAADGVAPPCGLTAISKPTLRGTSAVVRRRRRLET